MRPRRVSVEALQPRWSRSSSADLSAPVGTEGLCAPPRRRCRGVAAARIRLVGRSSRRQRRFLLPRRGSVRRPEALQWGAGASGAAREGREDDTRPWHADLSNGCAGGWEGWRKKAVGVSVACAGCGACWAVVPRTRDRGRGAGQLARVRVISEAIIANQMMTSGSF